MTISKKAALAAATMLAACNAMPAWAQDSDEGASTAANDIVVTARRIEERLQDVPISITVFNQQQLEQRNAFNGRDLAVYTPSLSVNTRYGSDFGAFAIRGFTQELRTTSSVGVYFADVVTPRSSPMSASGDGAGPGLMFDLQNVQVLKGPQGTLFGRNTTGGAVVLVPNRPTDKLEGYAEGSIGNYDMRRVQAVINLPASDTLRFRAGVDWQKRDGYLRNISGVGPKDLADINYVAARFSMLWDVTDSIENYTVASYSKSDTNGSAPKITDCNGTAVTGPLSYACRQIERERSGGTYDVNSWLPWSNQKTEIWQVTNTTKWQASDSLTVKNIMSYGETTQDQAMDLFGNWVPLGNTLLTQAGITVNVPAKYVGSGFGPNSDTSISANGLHAGHQGTFTEELQFQGNAGDQFNWQAGIYYERSRPLGFSGTQSMSGVFCDNQEQWANFTCTDATIVTQAVNASNQPVATGSRNYQVGKVHYQNIGLYGQATYKFSDQFSVDAGLRYTWDKSWGVGRMVTASYSATTGWNTPSFACIKPGFAYTDSSKFTPENCEESHSQKSSAPTWMIGLNYKPVEDVLLYAKYSRGYRQGSVNPLAAYTFEKYGPEKVDVWEGGLKASFNGPVRAHFNITGFYNKFRDMQLQISFVDTDPAPPTLSPGPAIVNAARSRIWGIEVEGGVQPIEGLSLQASYSYLNTKLLGYIEPDLTGSGSGYNRVSGGPAVGTRLTNTPKYKLTVGATYTLPTSADVGKVSFGAVYVRTGTVFYGIDATEATRYASIFKIGDPQRSYSLAPAYDLLNINFNWDHIAGSALSLGLFMNNVTGTVYYDARSPGSRGVVSRYLGEPRTYGMRTRFSF
ncbi:MAG: TonB-dependent receptor [Novosphingobium sp.]|nr:TonB-dependent receptor [Novosphingobium sp.]